MFGNYQVTLHRVYDHIAIREGRESLHLTVNGDAMRMVAGLNRAQAKMKELNDDSDDATVKDAAVYFATVIFGQEQAGKLMDFYADDPGCVISVCGRYFRERLAGRIAKAQKKQKL